MWKGTPHSSEFQKWNLTMRCSLVSYSGDPTFFLGWGVWPLCRGYNKNILSSANSATQGTEVDLISAELLRSALPTEYRLLLQIHNTEAFEFHSHFAQTGYFCPFFTRDHTFDNILILPCRQSIKTTCCHDNTIGSINQYSLNSNAYAYSSCGRITIGRTFHILGCLNNLDSDDWVGVRFYFCNLCFLSHCSFISCIKKGTK